MIMILTTSKLCTQHDPIIYRLFKKWNQWILYRKNISHVMDWSDIYSTELSLENFVNALIPNLPIISEINKLNSKKILEIGCGSSIISIFLSYLGYEVIAADIDQAVLQIAKKNNVIFNGRVKYKLMNAFDIEGRYDLVFSQGLLEHYTNIDIIKLIESALDASDTVIHTVPSCFYPSIDVGNERLLSIAEWNDILKDHFNVEFCYFGFYRLKRYLLKKIPFYILIKIKA